MHQAFGSSSGVRYRTGHQVTTGTALPIWHPLKSCPHCCRKVGLSHKSETVAENGETTATVSVFCDSVDRL